MLRVSAIVAGCAACSFTPGSLATDASLDDTARIDAPLDARGCAAVEVAAGAEHTCAVTADGSVYCWGRAASGETGVTPLTTRCTAMMYFCNPSPRRVELPAAAAIGLGNQYTCAATAAGSYCWGVNLHGAFGDGTTAGSSVPRAVPQRDGATLVEGGVYHACSVAGGVVKCSGQNVAGEVGDGTGMLRTTATTIGVTASAVSLGDYTSCVVTGGQLSCWGRNAHLQIGSPATNRYVPTTVSYVTDVIQVGTGRDHICAVKSDNTAACWGNNSYGQLGDGQTVTYSGVVQVGVANVVDLAVNLHHGCVRDQAGAVWCFGQGYAPTPAMIALPRPAVALGAGAAHDCAITDDGNVWCWGDQQSGQLGNGMAAAARTLVPQQAPICP